jgi:hypothetical protein
MTLVCIFNDLAKWVKLWKIGTTGAIASVHLLSNARSRNPKGAIGYLVGAIGYLVGAVGYSNGAIGYLNGAIGYLVVAIGYLNGAIG